MAHRLIGKPEPRVYVTDSTPHITYVNNYHFVILEIIQDETLLIFTPYQDVIKVQKEHYLKPDFDFKDYLLDEYHFRQEDETDTKRKFYQHHNLHGIPTVKGKRPPVDLEEEADMNHLRMINPQEPLEVYRRRRPLQPAEPHKTNVVFWNFDMPHVDFYDCWYHSSNTFTLNKPVEYYLYGSEIVIDDYINHPLFPDTPIKITWPPPHLCGLNTLLYVDHPNIQELTFCCPNRKPPRKGPPLNKTIYTVGNEYRHKCHTFFSYFPQYIGSRHNPQFLHNKLVQVINFRNKIWNSLEYRCRLDHDNRLSRFWLDKPINERTQFVKSHPEPATNHTQLLQSQEALRFSKIIIRIATSWCYDRGTHLIHTIQDSRLGDHNYLDLEKVPYLPYQHVEDMDARGRGFQFFYKHYNIIVFRNTIACNLYAVGNLTTNVYIDIIHNGTKIQGAWKRFRHPIRPALKGSLVESRPLLKSIEHLREEVEFVPFTLCEVGPAKPYTPSVKLHQAPEWTPIIMPCHPTDCTSPPGVKRDPDTLEVHVIDYYGAKRSYTASNDHLNRLIKHSIARQCSVNHKSYWKFAKDGPLPFLICGNLVDDKNHIDLARFQTEVLELPESSPTQEFITFSPAFGLCIFTEAQVKTEHEDPVPPEPPLFQGEQPPRLLVPVYNCGPGCVTPEIFTCISTLNTPEYQKWLSFLAYNSHKIKYLPSQEMSEKCSVNPNAKWHKYNHDGYFAFYCTNYSMANLTYHLPLFHPQRWTLAYQFTLSELKQLPWQELQDCQVVYMPQVTITRTVPHSPFYRVNRLNSNEFCDFSTLRYGIGMPIFEPVPDESVIYEPCEVDMEMANKVLQHLRHRSHNTDELLAASLKSLSLLPQQQQELDKALIQHTTGSDPEPGTEEYQLAANYFAEAMATGTISDAEITSVLKEHDPVTAEATSTSTIPLNLSKLFRNRKK